MKQTNKKSTAFPEELPHHQRQGNGNTPGGKNQQLAEFLLGCIGDRDHPIKRPHNRSVDRILRGLITERNAAGEDIIVNNGFGYFRPGPDDEDDLKQYLWAELHRAEAIEDKVQSMREAYYGRY